MRRSTLLLSAAAVDLLVGDPECLPHPVRLIGAAITRGEALLYPADPAPRRAFFAGALLTFSLVGSTYVLTRTLLRAPRVSRAALPPGNSRALLTILLASTTLAARNLDDEARPILDALAQNDIAQARTRLARIVGRDTGSLGPPQIHRALIETLAESLSDGIIAPLFYLALGGVPLALAFKAVSTLDSMIAHRTPRYFYFGRAAAHLDDAANFLPARLSAVLLLALGRARAPALRTFLRDRNQHASPNAGQPEAAMAAILDVQLGGPSTYDGVPHQAPLLNPGGPLPTLTDACQALRFTRLAAFSATALFAAVLLWRERSRP